MNEKEAIIKNISESAHITEQMKKIEEQLINKESSALKYSVKKPSGITIIAAILGIVFTLGGGFTDKDHVGAGLLAIVCFVIVAKYVLTTILNKTALDKIKADISSLDTEHKKLRNDSKLHWLPEAYRNSTDISMIASYIQNGRADTMREALNLLEQDKHNQRMEQAAAIGAYYGVQG